MRRLASAKTHPLSPSPHSPDSARPSSSSTLARAPTAADEAADPARFPYHARLHAAASAGDAAGAASTLEAMAAAGLPPGPAAFHGAIVASARAGDADTALALTRRAHAVGVRPLAVSYATLIRAFTGVGDAPAARAVLASMVRAVPDARPGWLALCKGLFAAGAGDEAATTAERGVLEGWWPDADLYGALISYLVDTGGQRGLARAGAILAEEMLPEGGVVPTTAHANIVLAGEVELTSAMEGDKLLAAMGRGDLGPGCRPDIHSFNIVLAGHVRAALYGDPAVIRPVGQAGLCAPPPPPGPPAPDATSPAPPPPTQQADSGLPVLVDVASAERIDEFIGEVLLASCLPDARTHALMCEAHTPRGNGVLKAMRYFRRMLALGTPLVGEGAAPPAGALGGGVEEEQEVGGGEDGEEAPSTPLPPPRLAAWGTPGAPGLTGPLSDTALAALLRALAVAGLPRPWDLLEVMTACAADGRTPPPGSLAPPTPPDGLLPGNVGGDGSNDGGVLLTPLSGLASWVPYALAAARSARGAAAGLNVEAKAAAAAVVAAEAEAEAAAAQVASLASLIAASGVGGEGGAVILDDGSAPGSSGGGGPGAPPPGSREIFVGDDAVWVDADGAAMDLDKDGQWAVVPVSRATLPQLVAELTARGLSTEGTKRGLYSRVQGARAARERDVIEAQRSPVVARKKAAARERASIAAAAADVRTAEKAVPWTVTVWEDGEVVSQYVKTAPPPRGEAIVVSAEDAGEAASLRALASSDEDDGGRMDGQDDEEDVMDLTNADFRRRAVARVTGPAGGGGDDEDDELLDFEADRVPGASPWWPSSGLGPEHSLAGVVGMGGATATPSRLALALLLAAERCGVAAPPADLAAFASAAARGRDEVLAAQVAARLPASLARAAKVEPGEPLPPLQPIDRALDLARDLLTAVTPLPEGGEEGGEDKDEEGSGPESEETRAARYAAAREGVLACLVDIGLGDRLPSLEADLAVSEAADAAAAAAVEAMEAAAEGREG